MLAKNFIPELRARGLIAQVSHEEELNQLLANSTSNSQGSRYAAYCGFDPTAASLHVGNLAAIMMLKRAQNAGLTPIVLFGGATGYIGDPTGRTDMRPMNSKEQIATYIENFKTLVRRYFDFDVQNPPIFVNNNDWMSKMSWLDFSRDIGVHFTVARLLSAEVNKTRFQEGGLTFMELGYQILQSYDFLHLYQNYNCIVQFGGDDQWSNVLGGADLIRRIAQGKAFAVTTPLLVGADGKKFGKTAGNAIWLDSQLTSPYEFFQFFRNIHDADIGKMLKVFTLMPEEEINNILQLPNINTAKEIMALEVTKLVHGQSEAKKALETSKALFSGDKSNLTHAPTTFLSLEDLTEGIDILNLLIRCQLTSSRGDGRKLILGGGLSWDGRKFSDFNYKIKKEDFDNVNKAIVLKKGKKDYHLVKIK